MAASLAHANRGRAWEDLLEQWHKRYRHARRAVVLRGHPPVKPLSPKNAKGQFRACFEGDGPPDFFGVINHVSPADAGAALGRALVFDAKATDNDRWSLDLLKTHQASDLEACHLAGGLAFVALCFRLGARSATSWALPWSTLGPRWRSWATAKRAGRGEASLTEADCEVIGFRMPELGDWLGALGGERGR